MYIKKHKYSILLFTLISVICIFIFVPYIISDTEFVLGWDMRGQYASYFENLRTVLRSSIEHRELPFYSWSSFLGNDYYSSKLFYYQDIFDYPFALLTNWSYYNVIILQTYLKFIIAGFSFFAYAKYHKFTGYTSTIGALMFSFSAYALQIMMHPFFASFFVFIPLYFLMVDKYIVDNKKMGFVIMTAFMFINNYYMFYSVSVFTILYFITRFYMYKGTFNGFLKNSIPLIGCYFVGFMISAVVVLPEILFVLSNERIGTSSNTLWYGSWIPYVNMFLGIFTPASVFANSGTEISKLYSFVTKNESVLSVFIWASSLLLLLLPQVLCDKKNGKTFRRIFVVITAFMFIPLLSSIMHGFSEPSFRWLFCPMFLLVVLVLPYIEDRDSISRKILKKTLIITVFITLTAVPFFIYMNKFNFALMLKEYNLFIVFTLMLVLMSIAIVNRNKYFLMCILVIELSLTSYYSFYGNPTFNSFSKDTMNKVHHVMQNKNDYNEWLMELNPSNNTSFIRNYVDPETVYWEMSLNLNLDFNIMGVITYDTTFEPSIRSLNELADVESYLPWAFDIRDENILNMLSVKYAIVTDYNQVPFKNYKAVGEFNYLPVFENEDYINFGKTYVSLISYRDYSGDTSILNDTLVVNVEDIAEISNYLGNTVSKFSSVTKTLNTVNAEIESGDDGFALISIPFNKGWKVLVNSNEVPIYNVSGGLIGIPITSGFNLIEMYFVPQGFKEGAFLSAIGSLLLLGWVIRKRVKNK